MVQLPYLPHYDSTKLASRLLTKIRFQLRGLGSYDFDKLAALA